MQFKPDDLRRHYHSLSDEALLEIQRADLVEAAQSCYDAELAERGLDPRGRKRTAPAVPAKPAEEPDIEVSQDDAGDDKPDWLANSDMVLSYVERPGMNVAGDMEKARDILAAAGIPCYLQFEVIPEDVAPTPARREWRLLVPGDDNLRATSILDRDIFNAEFENTWKAHLESFSDDELLKMRPDVVFCGLFDRIERITRAYDEELAHRGIEPESH